MINDVLKQWFSQHSLTKPPQDKDDIWHDFRTQVSYSKNREKLITLQPNYAYDFSLLFDLTTFSIPKGPTVLCDNAFEGLDELINIDIPDSVRLIGQKAFFGCTSLETISIPKSVQHIGGQAFDKCFSLRKFSSEYASDDGRCLIINGVLEAIAPCGLIELHIPDYVHSFVPYVFSSCNELKRIYLPDSIDSISLAIVATCPNLEEVFSTYASKDHKSIIKNGALQLCIERSIKDYSVAEGITSIEVGAFAGNESLISVHLPSTLKSISDYSFAGCHSLKHISIPSGVEVIGSGAFLDCQQLNRVILPESIKTLGSNVFEGCRTLKGISLPKHIDYIGPKTFKDCSSLIIVRIPDSVSSIGESAFENCSDLESITLPGGLKIIENELFKECEALRHIEIPESVRIIKRYSFWGCKNLQSISFPSSLESIENYAFNYCRSLEKLDLSMCISLQTIEDSTFFACSGLQSVSFPESLVSIGKEAFSYCSRLKTLTLPKSMKSVTHRAFEYCRLNIVSFQRKDTQISAYSFYRCSIEKVFIPFGALNYYSQVFRSLYSINDSGHMSFYEVGDSITGEYVKTNLLLSTSNVKEPLFQLGQCRNDYQEISERTYLLKDGNDTKLSPIKVELIHCYCSCTGCLRIGQHVYNWPEDTWPNTDNTQNMLPENVSAYIREADSIKSKNKKYDLLLLVLSLLKEETNKKNIEIYDSLNKVIGFELAENVEKNWNYTIYDCGNDPSQPSSSTPPPGGTIGSTIRLLYYLIRILEQYLL